MISFHARFFFLAPVIFISGMLLLINVKSFEFNRIDRRYDL